jgi:DNA-binding CsgD family transcriptional regulator
MDADPGSPIFMDEPLTRREREILALLEQILTTGEIADQLTLAVSSAKWYTL